MFEQHWGDVLKIGATLAGLAAFIQCWLQIDKLLYERRSRKKAAEIDDLKARVARLEEIARYGKSLDELQEDASKHDVQKMGGFAFVLMPAAFSPVSPGWVAVGTVVMATIAFVVFLVLRRQLRDARASARQEIERFHAQAAVAGPARTP